AHASVIAGEHRIVAEIGPADRGHQAFEYRVAVAGDDDMTSVRARIGVRRAYARQRAAAAGPDMAHEIVFRDHAFHQVEHALIDRGVDDLPPALAGLDPKQRHQRADHTMERCQAVADADADAGRRTVGITGREAQSAHGFADGAEPRSVAVRAGLSVAGDADQGQIGIDAGEHIPAKAELLEAARLEVLDHDIRLSGQAEHDVATLR